MSDSGARAPLTTTPPREPAAALLAAIRDALNVPPSELPGRVALVIAYVQAALDSSERYRLIADRLQVARSGS
jgi:hypothetical protein